MGTHVYTITTYIRQDPLPETEPPTNMQVTYAKEIADLLGLEPELSTLENTKTAYTQFLGKYMKQYKLRKKLEMKINETLRE